jgi:hypothetical protein
MDDIAAGGGGTLGDWGISPGMQILPSRAGAARIGGSRMLSLKASALGLALATTSLFAAAPASQFQNATGARIDGTYAMVQLASGKRSMVPLASLSESDRAFLTALAASHPLAKGKSEVTVVAETTRPATTAKKTIEKAVVVGDVETVQLCPPNILRDQLGGTCMFYSLVHYLDIAGYYVDNGTIYKTINIVPAEHPYTDPRYAMGMEALFTRQNPLPVVHDPSLANGDEFSWAREELRKGRPVLASFPREIWQALPPGFIAAHPWDGGKVGHQIVINGFTWNAKTRKGSFHIINSWAELPEFDLSTDAASGGAMVIRQSLSPKGEPPPKVEKVVVSKVTFIRPAGKTNLYEVETNLGKKRIAASDEDAARTMAEAGP